MLNADEARKKATGYKDLKEKIENKVKKVAESGGTSVVIMGVTDYTESKSDAEMAVKWLEDKGYDAYFTGVNLHIKW